MIPWSQTLVSANASSAAVTAASATDLVPNWDYTFPANFFQIGTKWRMHASGIMGTSATPGTETFAVQMGATVINASFGAITLVASAANQKWWLDIDVECRAIGAGTSTTFVATGLFLTLTALVATPPYTPLPATGAIAAGTGVDFTATQKLSLYGTFSVTGDTVTVEQYEVVLLQA
jgi:hypothetical protein